MTAAYDVAALGNAIVDVIAPADDAFLVENGLARGAMTLIDEARAQALYARMGAGVEASGGSAGNTVAGVASLGGRAAYIGKVADDQLGEVFAHDLRAGGVAYATPPLVGGAATARCLISVTPDGQRTMSTYLGASIALTPADVDAEMIKGAQTTFLEGYLFDPDGGRQAFAKAATLARDAGRRVALTMSDVFVVERHRAGLMAFLDSVDLLFANEGEAKAMCQTEDFDAALRMLGERVEIIAVTRGDQGSVVVAGGQRTEVPAAAIESLVDTTGAGDQYAAGFLFGLARGLSMDVCGRLGSLAAAEVIQHYGPRPMTSLAKLAHAAGLLQAEAA